MSKTRQPWPMKWIALAILLLIVPYTILTLRYRKPGPAFRPYEDLKDRANVSRLLAAGYQRIPLPAERPADQALAPGGAGIQAVAGGVPPELQSTLVETPPLPVEILQVSAAPTASPLRAYRIHFTCMLPDDKLHLGGAELYLRENQIIILPTFEPVSGALLTRSRHTVVQLTVPAGTLDEGRYDVTLVGERASRAWALEVR